MVGFYTDSPGYKMFYDRDGSAGFYAQNGAIGALSAGNLQALNNESNTGGIASMDPGTASGGYYVGMIFPQLRIITDYWLNCYDNSGGGVNNLGFQYSSDSTTGLDGTWTTAESWVRGAGGQNNSGSAPGTTWRTAIRHLASAIASCKAVRVGMSSSSNKFMGFVGLHLYGDLVAGQTPDRLRLWHPTLDQEISATGFDFAEAQRLTTPNKTFRVKNNSASLTANGIVISMDALTDTSPTIVGVTTFDFAGSGYSSTQNIGALAPGAISSLCTVKVSPGATATIGLWRQRVKAVATSWS